MLNPFSFVKSTRCGEFDKGTVEVTLKGVTRRVRAIRILLTGDITAYQLRNHNGTATIHWSKQTQVQTYSDALDYRMPIRPEDELIFL